MSEKEFRLTTPRYFYFRQKGFEGVQTEEWKRTRMITFYSFRTNAKKPEDVFRLPGETIAPQFSDEEKARATRILAKAKQVDFFKGETITPEA